MTHLLKRLASYLCIVILSLPAPANAEKQAAAEKRTFYIDFGVAAAETGGWNNFTEAQSSLPSKTLIDNNGAASSIIFAVESDPSNGYGAGTNSAGYVGDMGEFPASACRDSYFSFGQGGEYKLKNLNPQKFYNIEIFGSRNVADDKRVGVYRIGDETQTLDAAVNTTRKIIFFNVRPDAAQEIALFFGVAPNSDFGYLNAMKITESDGPEINRPTDFTALWTPSGVSLSWTDNSADEVWFMIERKKENDPYELLGMAPANATLYQDPDINYGYRYVYRISAMNMDDKSLYSEATVLTPVDPNPPNERRFLIDLGEESRMTVDNYWNNVAGPQTDFPATPLTGQDGNRTKLQFEVVSDASNDYANGGGFNSLGFNQDIGGYPASAVSDCYFSYASGGVYRFTGLLPERYYDIVIFGSRVGADNDRVGVYTVNGFTQELDAANNTSRFTTFYKEKPTAEGVIELKFGVAPGSQFGYINVIELKETAVAALAAPEGLSASNVSYDQVQLDWQDASGDEVEIYRSVNNNLNFKRIGATSQSFFVDEEVEPNSLYVYRIRSSSANDKSPYSAELNVTTPRNPNLLTYFVNFTQHDEAQAPWNNVGIEPVVQAAAPNLMDDRNMASGIAIIFQNEWSGYNDLGAVTGDNTGIFPDAVAKTALWTGANKKTLLITGLKQDRRYNFGFFGSRSGAGDRTTFYKIGRQIKKLNAAGNTTGMVEINNTFPDAEGKILVEIEKGPGSGYAYLNAMVIEEWVNAGPPPAPANLQASVHSRGVALQWTDEADNETSYEIYKAVNNRKYFELAASVLPDQSEFLDNLTIPNNTYYYKIRAVNNKGASDFIETTVNFGDIPLTNDVLINFTNASDGAPPWNNFIYASEPEQTLQNLIDRHLQPTDISVTMTQPFEDVNTLGMSTGDGIYPDNVMKTSFWFQNGGAQLLVCGLKQNVNYNFTFFGSRDGGGDRTTIYTIGDQSSSLNASFNTHDLALVQNISADANGCATIDISKAPQAQYGYLNAMTIEMPSEITVEAPSALSAIENQQNNTIRLEWQDNSRNETGFEIYSSDDGEFFQLEETVAANQESYTHSGAPAGYYKLRAVNATGISLFTYPVNTENLQVNVHSFTSEESGFRFQTDAGVNLGSRRVVILGSSTSEGYGASHAISTSYIARLENYLADYYFDVVNLAKGGFRSADILPQGDPEKNITRAISLRPTFIIVNLPSNDVASGFSNETTIANLTEIKNIAEAHKIKVFFTTSQPRNFAAEPPRQQLADQAELIKQTFGNDAIDVFAPLADASFNIKPELNADNIHVNDAGHQIIFDQTLSVMKPYIKSTLIRLKNQNLPSGVEIVNDFRGRLKVYSNTLQQIPPAELVSVNLNGQLHAEGLPLFADTDVTWFFSVKSGSWSDPTVWSNDPGGPPATSVPAGNAIVVISGHAVDITSESYCKEVILKDELPGSSLTVTNGILHVKDRIALGSEQPKNRVNISVGESGGLHIQE